MYKRQVVSYLIFPGSADPEAGPPDYEKLTAKCQELLHDIGGMGKDFVEGMTRDEFLEEVEGTYIPKYSVVVIYAC